MIYDVFVFSIIYWILVLVDSSHESQLERLPYSFLKSFGIDILLFEHIIWLYQDMLQVSFEIKKYLSGFGLVRLLGCIFLQQQMIIYTITFSYS